MRSENRLRDRQRSARFESFEERLALSAQPLSEFCAADPLGQQLEHHYGELTSITGISSGDFNLEGLDGNSSDEWAVSPQLNDAHILTGLLNARTSYGFDGDGQTVAIIDSGIAYDHYALGGGYGSSYRVVGGWDFAENDANPYDDAPAGFHGTHVAGIVGSTDATYSGVAPGVDLVALRVFDDNGGGYFSWTEQALQWVHTHRNDYANPITTVNLSLGTTWNADTPPSWAMLEDEFATLEADGIFISVSAGNSFTTYNAPGLSYPAASPNVVPVASVDNNGTLSYFSQRNSQVIAAPGRSIISTVPDFVTGSNGVPNDFASASGTSMAAPYVAGAATLIREAMQFVNYVGINQDAIYNVMRNTADIVYDSATSANYYRLNIQRAIESLMPVDDFGSTDSTAGSLGTIQTSVSFSGVIGQLNDVDRISFTAGQTGRITFSVSATSDLTPTCQVVGGSGTLANNQLSFDVVAGQSYALTFGTSSGLGRYNVTANLTATAVDLGSITYRVLADQTFQGSRTYNLSASRDGTLSIQADFLQSGGNIDLELYNSSNQLIASSRSVTNQERIDVTVTSGQSLQLRVVGTNSDVDVRLANFVRASNGQVDFYGTDAADSISFVAGSEHVVTLNGMAYRYASSQFSTFRLNGGAGYDSLTIQGTSAAETATFRAGSLQFNGTTLNVTGDSVEYTVAISGGGNDTARFYDSAGNEEYFSNSTYSRMSSSSFYNYGEGFQNVYAYATGGVDRAELYDTHGNDELIMTAGYSRLTATSLSSFYSYVAGFDTVQAYAYNGGEDRVDLYGSTGNDTVVSNADSTQLQGSGVTLNARSFDRNSVYAGGGTDRVDLYDSAGNDELIATPQYVRIAATGSYRYFEGFDQVYAYATAGGTDYAGMYDSSGDDEVLMTPAFSRMFGNGFYYYASGFDRVDAFGSGGYDRADLYDSAGDDSFLAAPTFGRLTGAGFYNYAAGFDRVYGFATAGGNDSASMYGVGLGDELIARSTYSRLLGSNFYQYAQGFEQLSVYSNGTTTNTNTASVNGVTTNTTQQPTSSSLRTQSCSLSLHGFSVLTTRNDQSESTIDDVGAVDFLFQLWGDGDQ